MTENVYLVIEFGSGDSSETKRVYTDRAEAEAFVEAVNAVSGYYYEVEEIRCGAPDVAYDGPVWIGTWNTRRKLAREKQLVLVSENGIVTVVPSFVPSQPYTLSDLEELRGGSYHYQEFFTGGPGWRDLAKPPEYEEPAVWIDSLRYRQEWHTGDDPTPALITTRRDALVEVRGTSKEHVEQLLRETALQVKTERGIA